MQVIFLSHWPPYFLKQSLALYLELIYLGWRPMGDLLPLPSEPQDDRHCNIITPLHLAFYMGSGLWTPVLTCARVCVRMCMCMRVHGTL